jgi:predicted outer membrane protein
MVEHRYRWLGLAALVLVATFSLARAAAPSEESIEFVHAASRSNATLLQAARIAQKPSRDERVRAFASSLATDHTQANDVLTELCRRRNIPLPTQSAGADALSDTSGETFDRVYTLETSQQLAKAEQVFSAASQSPAVDPELKDFARRRLATIREQAQRAGSLAQAQAGVSTSSPKPEND